MRTAKTQAKLLSEVKKLGRGFFATPVVSGAKYKESLHLLLKQIINKENKKGVYVCANLPYEFVLREMKENGIKTGNLFFIDIISSSLSEPKKCGNCIFLPSPKSLCALSSAIYKALRIIPGIGETIFIDSLSTLLLYNNEEDFVDFLGFLSKLVTQKKLNGIMMYVNKDINKNILDTVLNLSDNVLYVK